MSERAFGEVEASKAKPSCPRLVAGIGGLKAGGSSGKVCASDGVVGSLSAATAAISENTPAAHGSLRPSRSTNGPLVSSALIAFFVAARSGVLNDPSRPPSMSTRPSRSL